MRWARLTASWTWAQISDALRVRANTLQRWVEQWTEDRLAIRELGRPLERADRPVRTQILAALGLLGPETPVAVLQELFPNTARRELEDILRRYRFVNRKRGTLLHVLHWRNDGACWAMDFTEAPVAIDTTYPHVLVVRDLGSGKLLLALPATSQDAQVVRDALDLLFLEYGAPLVLKSDNGSGFTAARTKAMLDDWGVVQLLSPPGTPRYNGACEAGIGGLKTRAHYLAARDGRPGEWSCDDIEGARLLANQTARPFGHDQPAPDQRWQERDALSQLARDTLQRALERATTEERARITAGKDRDLTPNEEAAVLRIATCRALIELGHLQLRRRRFSLPIRPGKVGIVSS